MPRRELLGPAVKKEILSSVLAVDCPVFCDSGFEFWFFAFLVNTVEPFISQINGTKQTRRLGKGKGEWRWGDRSMVSSYKPGQS